MKWFVNTESLRAVERWEMFVIAHTAYISSNDSVLIIKLKLFLNMFTVRILQQYWKYSSKI